MTSLYELAILVAVKKFPGEERGSIAFMARKYVRCQQFENTVALKILGNLMSLGYVAEESGKLELSKKGMARFDSLVETISPLFAELIGA